MSPILTAGAARIHDAARALARSPLARIALSAYLPLFYFRVLQLGSGWSPHWGDASGLAADLALAAVFALLLVGLWQLWRLSLFVPLPIWTYFHYANYEHLSALGGVLNLFHADLATDPTFLYGSALHPTSPVVLAVALLLSLASAFVASRPSPRPLRPWRLVPVAAVAVGIYMLIPSTSTIASWRQSHFLLQNLAWLHQAPEFEPSRESIPGYFPGDLRGAPRVPLGQPHNVLIVTMEGISGRYLPAVAAHHDVEPETSMLGLAAFADRHLQYASFVSVQRQTNRGMYSILCGDLPKLIEHTPKMSEVASEGRVFQPCLAGVLADAGYRTVFMQAAPLPYMDKERFARAVGFHEIHGNASYKERHFTGRYWGVDDRTLFDHALRRIRKLEESQAPWLITLLTAGTHHPYAVPPSHESPDKTGFIRSVDYLDTWLAHFLSTLEREGYLNDTLLIITSDEAPALPDLPDDIDSATSQAWGILVIAAPGDTPELITEPFMQLDLALSVADYVGSSARAGHLGGRSALRRYDSSRPLVFGNVLLRKVGLVDPRRSVLLLCAESLEECQEQYIPDSGWFSLLAYNNHPQPGRASYIAALRSYVRRSLTTRGIDVDNAYQLAHPGSVPLESITGSTLIFGAQNFLIPAGTKIEAELLFHVESNGGAGFQVSLTATSPFRHIDVKVADIPAKSAIALRFTYTATEEITALDCNLRIHRQNAATAPVEGTLTHKGSWLRLVPADQKEPAGLKIQEYRVDPLH